MKRILAPVSGLRTLVLSGKLFLRNIFATLVIEQYWIFDTVVQFTVHSLTWCDADANDDDDGVGKEKTENVLRKSNPIRKAYIHTENKSF